MLEYKHNVVCLRTTLFAFAQRCAFTQILYSISVVGWTAAHYSSMVLMSCTNAKRCSQLTARVFGFNGTQNIADMLRVLVDQLA